VGRRRGQVPHRCTALIVQPLRERYGLNGGWNDSYYEAALPLSVAREMLAGHLSNIGGCQNAEACNYFSHICERSLAERLSRLAVSFRFGSLSLKVRLRGAQTTAAPTGREALGTARPGE
jgi:hypothetical protein